jgi:hypothetical protein
MCNRKYAYIKLCPKERDVSDIHTYNLMSGKVQNYTHERRSLKNKVEATVSTVNAK